MDGLSGWYGFGIMSEPVETISFSGLITPSASAAYATNGFTIEPGMYAPPNARLRSGRASLVNKSVMEVLSVPSASVSGS
jgi:hypothetical protein